MAVLVVALKYVLHILGFEPVEQSSLHNGVISSVTFVIGFFTFSYNCRLQRIRAYAIRICRSGRKYV